MKPIPTLILAAMCITFLFQIAPPPVSAKGNTYLIKLKNGGEITCHKMSVKGDTIFYIFSAYGQGKVGINKSAVKAIFEQIQGNGKNPPTWGKKNILPQVMDPSHGPWQ